jgi:nicotinamidase/pyrazinamidase
MELHTQRGDRPYDIPRAGDALIIVDVQIDFLPGGALGIPMADSLLAPLNRSIRAFERHGLPVFATRDWHPPGHRPCDLT